MLCSCSCSCGLEKALGKRFSISTADGVAAAAADLKEQAHGEPTVDLRTHLEVKRVKTMFRSFEELLRSGKENRDA